LGELESDINPTRMMRTLTVAQTQVVEIAKALGRQADVILMDEPTAALSDHEVAALFRAITRLKVRGVAIVYTTHKMDEVFRLADRISVLRDGRLVGTAPAAELNPTKLITMMVGRELADVFPVRHSPSDEILLEVSRLTREPAFRDISFQVRRGEVVALAGLMGAGRTEVVSAIFGLQPASEGQICLKGTPLSIRNPQDALAAGIGMVTEDRKGLGLIPALGVGQNITLSALRDYGRGPLINHSAEAAASETQMSEFAVKATSPSQPIAQLSGGNQQKALLARCLLGGPDLIILDEPTRGIDIGAKAEIYALIQKLARAGKGILLVSSELPEVLSLAHRIVVLRRGSVSATLDAAATDQETVLRHAMPL
jgi:inositol transport system ATP-binding protein